MSADGDACQDPVDTAETWTVPPRLRALDGSEAFAGLESSVIDFWRFAMSDLRMNNVRGYLAEFLVARAVGATGPRVEWDAYDVLAPDGTRIEVKASAYVQAWAQRRPSRITFTGLTGRTWTPEGGSAEEQTFNADVYVFAVQTAVDHDTYNPLDVHQWQFYVLPRQVLAGRGNRSISLATLKSLDAGPHHINALAEAITAAPPVT